MAKFSDSTAAAAANPPSHDVAELFLAYSSPTTVQESTAQAGASTQAESPASLTLARYRWEPDFHPKPEEPERSLFEEIMRDQDRQRLFESTDDAKQLKPDQGSNEKRAKPEDKVDSGATDGRVDIDLSRACPFKA